MAPQISFNPGDTDGDGASGVGEVGEGCQPSRTAPASSKWWCCALAKVSAVPVEL